LLIAITYVGCSVGIAYAEPFARSFAYVEEGPTFPGNDNFLNSTVGDEEGLRPDLRRRIIDYPSHEVPGTIVVDPGITRLFLVLGGGRAMQYGIGVGREGFEWSGIQQISRKTEWPDWIPPQSMIGRQPYLPRWVGGGPGNPLGARALYLGASDYRIHGTNDPSSIGKHVSSGCIRLLNQDVIDLYNRVSIGAKVIVLPETRTASRAHSAQRSVADTAQFPVPNAPRAAGRFHASSLY
jgi:lipoprotein-anchoring transpeptidase ErfK/SrfK